MLMNTKIIELNKKMSCYDYVKSYSTPHYRVEPTCCAYDGKTIPSMSGMWPRKTDLYTSLYPKPEKVVTTGSRYLNLLRIK